MELHQLLPDFRIESLAWIELMNGSLLHLERMPGCHVAIDNLLYATNALKGSAGLFGLDYVVDLAKEMENVLARLNSDDRASPNDSLIALLLACCEQMKTLIEQTDPDWAGKPDWENQTMEMALLSQLKEAQYSMSPA